MTRIIKTEPVSQTVIQPTMRSTAKALTRAAKKKDFLTLLDESYKAHHTFEVFLGRVLQEWGDGDKRMSPTEFSELMRKKNAEGVWAHDPTVHAHTIYGWLQPETETRIPGDVIQKMISAFVPPVSLPPDIAEIPHAKYQTELKLYRVANGQSIDKRYTQQLISKAKLGGNYREQFAPLIKRSGIDRTTLENWFGIRLEGLYKGEHMRSPRRAAVLVDLLNPPTLFFRDPKDPEIIDQNIRLVEIATGKPLSPEYENEIRNPEKRVRTPLYRLFERLLGATGSNISDEDIAKEMTIRLERSYNAGDVNERRLGIERIIESEALAIIAIAGAPEDQKETHVDILTGCQSPPRLLERVFSTFPETKISIHQMFRMSRLRKDIKRNEFGIAEVNVFHFENGRPLCVKHANEFADKFDFQKSDRRRFVLLACHEPVLTRDEIMELVQPTKKPTPPEVALRVIVTQTGIPVDEIARMAGVKYNTARNWICRGRIRDTRIPMDGIVAENLFLGSLERAFKNGFNKMFVSTAQPQHRSALKNPRGQRAQLVQTAP